MHIHRKTTTEKYTISTEYTGENVWKKERDCQLKTETKRNKFHKMNGKIDPNQKKNQTKNELGQLSLRIESTTNARARFKRKQRDELSSVLTYYNFQFNVHTHAKRMPCIQWDTPISFSIVQLFASAILLLFFLLFLCCSSIELCLLSFFAITDFSFVLLFLFSCVFYFFSLFRSNVTVQLVPRYYYCCYRMCLAVQTIMITFRLIWLPSRPKFTIHIYIQFNSVHTGT